MARMRKKKNLVSRTEACAEHFFEEPKDNRGKWREACGMPSDCRMFVEIGCGKGSFSEQMARKYPDVCYVVLPSRDGKSTARGPEESFLYPW